MIDYERFVTKFGADWLAQGYESSLPYTVDLLLIIYRIWPQIFVVMGGCAFMTSARTRQYLSSLFSGAMLPDAEPSARGQRVAKTGSIMHYIILVSRLAGHALLDVVGFPGM